MTPERIRRVPITDVRPGDVVQTPAKSHSWRTVKAVGQTPDGEWIRITWVEGGHDCFARPNRVVSVGGLA